MAGNFSHFHNFLSHHNTHTREWQVAYKTFTTNNNNKSNEGEGIFLNSSPCNNNLIIMNWHACMWSFFFFFINILEAFFMPSSRFFIYLMIFFNDEKFKYFPPTSSHVNFHIILQFSYVQGSETHLLFTWVYFISHYTQQKEGKIEEYENWRGDKNMIHAAECIRGKFHLKSYLFNDIFEDFFCLFLCLPIISNNLLNGFFQSQKENWS